MSKLNNVRLSPVARVGSFLLCLVMASVCFWSSFVTLYRWDDIWLGGDYYRSNTAEQNVYPDRNRLNALLDLMQREEWGGSLTYSEREQIQSLTQSLSPEVTNFRFQIHDEDGTPILNNLNGGVLDRVVPVQYRSTWQISQGGGLADKDYSSYSKDGEQETRVVYTEKGFVALDPTESEHGVFNQYGYLVEEDGQHWAYNSEYDQRILRRDVALEYGIAFPMVVEDSYSVSRVSYENMQTYLPSIALLSLLTLLATAGLVIFLCTAAGRQEDGTITTGWQERIPYDVYLVLDGFFFSVLLGGGDSITYGANQSLNRPVVIGLGAFTLIFAALALALILTTAVRVKAKVHNSITGRCIRAIGRFFVGIGRNWPVTKRVTLLFLLYLLGTVFTTVTFVLIPVYQGFVLWALCRWLHQWRSIRSGTERIVSGDPDVKIDTTGMYKELRQHAEQLNDLGSAVNSAVEEQLKSERFKAELITNVSHDLKTPLTSIINYVNLLKKLPIDQPAAQEYIEVLERKSMRLKKLTEDLVEASKASTGNLPVLLERLGMGQLLEQALAEYEERFAQKRLEVVPSMPHDEMWVWADGRHLWRVLDNMLSNCAKYAMEGTRVYVEVSRWEGRVFLTVKNVSRQALNIPPEQLMERFVRGEESRTTEGSGLGLSIARSLTELQGGDFRLEIDGDLFKVSVSLPEAMALPEAEIEFSLPKAE